LSGILRGYQEGELSGFGFPGAVRIKKNTTAFTNRSAAKKRRRCGERVKIITGRIIAQAAQYTASF
jgi:hypothetical protein